MTYVPAYKHTHLSDVKISSLPAETQMVHRTEAGLERVPISIKSAEGILLEDAIPSVSIVKDGSYTEEEYDDAASVDADLKALIEVKFSLRRLAGFVLEGLVPYGSIPSERRQNTIQKAIFSGLPTVRVGRGSPEGFADPHPLFIAGSNLTATKARLLLMACLMKFGSLPLAVDPENPTTAEIEATMKAVAAYQAIFDSH